MRGVLIAGLVTIPGMFAQTLVDPFTFSASLPAAFSANPVERPLRCDVTPFHPILDFGFRFQAGYSVSIPMEQYAGPRHGWAIFTRVTPTAGAPAYLAARVQLPDVPKTKVKADIFGGFVVGSGRYHVEWALFDDQNRVCRKEWNIEAKLKHGERNVKLAVPDGTVADFGGHGLPQQSRPRDDAAPFRLTILLHAAPATPRRTHLRLNDRLLLISTLSSLVGRVPAHSIRLVVFNLDQQKILFQEDGFTLAALGRVAQALNLIQLDAVDYRTLQNRTGPIDLLSQLINDEENSAKPSDAVVFLGPASRYADRLPASAIETTSAKIRFFYFQYRQFPIRAGAMMPDSISNAIGLVRGRLIHIGSPLDFANAIVQLERAAATAHNSSFDE